MKITDKSYVAEWSHSQQQYHFHTVEMMLQSNINQHNNNKGPDYIPLAFFDTAEEASKYIDYIETKQRKK